MKKIYKKSALIWLLAGLIAVIVGIRYTVPEPRGGAPTTTTETASTTSSTSQESTEKPAEAVLYQNSDYGFSFSLPESWQGYTVITDTWAGLAPGGDQAIETGPLISIRNPGWTSENPRQDIPIMIFTLGQWQALSDEKFHIGAAPIGPSELGRNNQYVFALPARYNYAYLTGYEEVEQILNSKPLQVQIIGEALTEDEADS